MNIIEAIKSGRPFRRILWTKIGGEKTWIKNSSATLFETDDVLANDWEVMEPTVTITKSQFWDAYSDVIKNDPALTHIKGYSEASLIDALIRRLGLGESSSNEQGDKP